MKAADAFAGLIALIIVYFPIYFFSQSIIKPLPKIYYRRPNKLETVLLLPFGLAYNLLSLYILYWGSFYLLGDSISGQYCQSARNLVAFILAKIPSLSGMSLILFPHPPLSLERDLILYSLFLASYWVLFIWMLPSYIGKVFGEAYLEIEPLELIRTKWKDLRPLGILLKYCSKEEEADEDAKKLVRILKPIQWRIRFELLKAALTFLNPVKLIAVLLNNYSKIPLVNKIPILGSWNPIDSFVRITSSNKTPSFAKDFTDKNFQRVLDVTLQNGKMFSGVLNDYRLDESDNIEYLELANTVRWKHDKYTDSEKYLFSGNIREVEYEKYTVKEKLVPGDSFLVPFRAIEEINITKIPRNKVFLLSGFSSAESAELAIVEHIVASGKYVYNGVSIYIISGDDSIGDKVLSLLKKRFVFFDHPKVEIFESEKLVRIMLDDYLTPTQKKNFLIELKFEQETQAVVNN